MTPPEEPKKDGPPEHPTRELPKVDIPAMLTSLAADMKQVLNATDKMSGDVDMLISDGRKTNQRLTRVEERLDDFDSRLTRHSGGARQLSSSDESQNAAIGLIKGEVEGLKESQKAQTEKLTVLEQKTDYQTTLLTEAKDAAAKLWRHPGVRLLAGAIWGWVLYELGKRGIDVPK